MKPASKPANPNFSSGPCSKRPGYSLDQLDISTLGRSHRAKVGKSALERACVDTAKLLGLPEGYRVGVVPASDTGAMEMAMWSMLGARPVDVFAWESFGKEWQTDIVKQLKLDNVNSYVADYGQLPDMSQANPAHDIIFTMNGTTSKTNSKMTMDIENTAPSIPGGNMHTKMEVTNERIGDCA